MKSTLAGRTSQSVCGHISFLHVLGLPFLHFLMRRQLSIPKESVCTHMCMCVYMYACMHICTGVYVGTYVHVCAHVHVCALLARAASLPTLGSLHRPAPRSGRHRFPVAWPWPVVLAAAGDGHPGLGGASLLPPPSLPCSPPPPPLPCLVVQCPLHSPRRVV